MRKINENYSTIYLLGNNTRDVMFMNYLFLSQNVLTNFYEKLNVEDLILKNIAFYFGNNGPMLLDNNKLLEIINANVDKKENIELDLTGKEIYEQINCALNSDAVYLCNSDGNIDKQTMFMLGYLMASKHEIFLWNEINESEWLMYSISRLNEGNNNIVQFPLEIIRSLAFPYLLKVNNVNIEVGRNTEFNLMVNHYEVEKDSVVLLGSLTKQLDSIFEEYKKLSENGYKILAPKLSKVKTNENGFVVFEDDISSNPISIESDFIEKCLKSENIIVCDKDGYIGNTVMFEIGYLLAYNKNITFIQEPNDKWLIDYITILKNNNVHVL